MIDSKENNLILKNFFFQNDQMSKARLAVTEVLGD